jgi:hypothetical protein
MRMKIIESGKKASVMATLVIVLASSLLTLPGQETKASRQTAEPSAETSSRGYDFEINNGLLTRGGSTSGKPEATLGNVIDAVRQRYPDANIVMSPGLARVRVSDLKLRARSIWEELEAIRVASGGRFEWSGPASPVFGRMGSPDPSKFAAESALEPAGLPRNNGLFTLREAVTPERERSIEAFNIGPYLQHAETQDGPEIREKRLAEVEMMIVETIGALHDEEAEKPRFQFHAGANLLVVIGSHEAVAVARKIVNALPGQANFPGAENTDMVGEPMSPVEMNNALRRRYGMSSHSPETEAFRKRYGLDRTPPPAGQPQSPGAGPNP